MFPVAGYQTVWPWYGESSPWVTSRPGRHCNKKKVALSIGGYDKTGIDMSKTPKTVFFFSIPSKWSIIQTWISRNWHFWNFSRGKLYTWNLLPHIRTRRNSTPSWMRQGQHVSKPFVSDRDVLFSEFCRFLTEMIRPKKEEMIMESWSMMGICRITVLLSHNNQAWLIVISACLLHIRYTSHLGRKRWLGAMWNAAISLFKKGEPVDRQRLSFYAPVLQRGWKILDL